MPALTPVVFAAPRSFAVALMLLLAILAVARYRRLSIPGIARIFFAIGLFLLGLAAAQPLVNRQTVPRITVMVDLSPSTRGALYRDRDSLDSRVHQVLGDQSFDMVAFADGNQALPVVSALPDIPVDQTRFDPPSADAIILFSDGQFDLPAFAPPTYAVIDPALADAQDAAVTDLRLVGPQVIATVTHNGKPRGLRWTGATPLKSDSSYSRTQTQIASPTGDAEITAAISSNQLTADRWPENDSLTLALPTPIRKEKWWVGENAPAGWHPLSELPTDPAAYLQPSIVTLNDIAAEAISSSQQTRLLQYVRELGGSLVIVGGPRAFAAGQYQNTPLDQLSPLASFPPEPTLAWLLLIDGSGSMAGDAWNIELTSLNRMLRLIPPDDAVSVGSFAESLNWWSIAKPANMTARLPLPPHGFLPHGPTNLAAVLDQITDQSIGSAETRLLLMTDADADFPHPAQLSKAMVEKKIHLHLLAIGQGSALPALRKVAADTGGSVLQETDPQQWVAGAKQLLKSAMPDHYQHRSIPLTPPLPPTISDWNQTWLKSNASLVQNSGPIPMIATWQLGVGRVTAIAYPADDATIQRHADAIAQSPSDPRFAVHWETGAQLRITVDAIDQHQFLNGQSIQLEMQDPRGTAGELVTQNIPQTAPGKYELVLSPPRTSKLLRVYSQRQTLRQFAVAGRYAKEFEKIGNNLANLQELGSRTGGGIITPGNIQPIEFVHPAHQTSLTSELAFAGFTALGIGLLLLRSSNRAS